MLRVGDKFEIDYLVIESFIKNESVDMVNNVVIGLEFKIFGSFVSRSNLYVNDLFSNDDYGSNKFLIKEVSYNKYKFESVVFDGVFDLKSTKFMLSGIPVTIHS